MTALRNEKTFADRFFNRFFKILIVRNYWILQNLMILNKLQLVTKVSDWNKSNIISHGAVHLIFVKSCDFYKTSVTSEMVHRRVWEWCEGGSCSDAGESDSADVACTALRGYILWKIISQSYLVHFVLFLLAVSSYLNPSNSTVNTSFLDGIANDLKSLPIKLHF